MGRPKLETDKKLSERFIFRLTKDELSRINAAATLCGKPPGVLVRQKLFKGKFPQAQMPQMDKDTYLELKKIGVNLNQLTKLFNGGYRPNGLTNLLYKLLAQQQIIISKLTHDSQSENR